MYKSNTTRNRMQLMDNRKPHNTKSNHSMQRSPHRARALPHISPVKHSSSPSVVLLMHDTELNCILSTPTITHLHEHLSPAAGSYVGLFDIPVWHGYSHSRENGVLRPTWQATHISTWYLLREARNASVTKSSKKRGHPQTWKLPAEPNSWLCVCMLR